MLLSDVLTQIRIEWHLAFVKFVETGEASVEFLAYVDADERCQDALERIFKAHAEAARPYVVEINHRSSQLRLVSAPRTKTTIARNGKSRDR